MTTHSTTSRRFETLDALRGAAALAVLSFHTVNTVVVPGSSAIADLFLRGWLGVFVFFPVSGYCILAATCSKPNALPSQFLRRRWWRIFPTYWASIVLTVLLLLVTSPFSSADLSQLAAPGWKWISILTLTQTLAGIPQSINPVYWSLCYEEQFYLLIALSLLLPIRLRAAALLAVSIAACGWRLTVGSAVITGWFVDYWLEFAVGMAVFGWSHPAFGRSWAGVLIALGVVVYATQGQLATLTSVTVALLMLAIRPWDNAVARARVVRGLAGIGVMSYSLYLVHVPVAGRMVNGLRRLLDEPSHYWAVLLGVAAPSALVVAYVFYRVVEVRFLPGKAAMDPAAAPTPRIAWSVLAG